MLQGYADRLKSDRRGQAWTVSHLLVAAGCDPDKVTPAKLMGEKERRPKGSRKDTGQMSIEESWRILQVEAK